MQLSSFLQRFNEPETLKMAKLGRELRAKGIQAFYKDDLDHHEFSRTWSQLLIEIKILIPI